MQAKGRLQCWNADGQERAATLEQQRLTGLVEAAAEGFRGLKPGKRQANALTRESCAGKGQAAMLERWRPGKSSNPGAAKADGQAWWKLPRRVLGIWSLANGRLECPNKRRLCRQRAGCNAGTLTARKEQQPWSSKGWRPGLVEAAAEGFRHLKPGKRQARMP